jgi:hypothetical protein
VEAAALRRELTRAAELKQRPVADLAMSPRTISVITLRWPPPPGTESKLVTEWGVDVPLASGAETLGDVFGSLIDDLLAVAGTADDGVVEVIDC